MSDRTDGKRAYIYLSRDDLHRLLGLPDDVRVVTLERKVDPPYVRVVIEGDSLPGDELWPGSGTSAAELAYRGVGEAPPLWHPIHGDGHMTPRLGWDKWKPGDPVEPFEAWTLKVEPGAPS